MAKTFYKMSNRKYLKKPDVLLERLRKLYAWTEQNLQKVILGAFVVFGGVAIAIGIQTYFKHKETKALTAYYIAKKAFEKKQTDVGTKKEKDLEKALEKEIFELKAIAEIHAKSKAALLSNLMLGEFYTSQKQYDKAIDFYQKAHDMASGHFYKILSLYNLGYLYEKKGDYTSAIPWFQKITDMKKQRVLLWTVGYRPNAFWLSNAYFGIARCRNALNQKDLAKEAYLRVSDEFPNTPYADQAQAHAGLLHE